MIENDRYFEGADVVEAIRAAYEIELGGVALYGRGAEETDHPELKELFQRLAAMEREHMVTLSRRYHIPEMAWTSELTPAEIAVYTGHDEPVKTPADLLRLAVHLENRARHFFLETGRHFDPSSAEWRLYRELEAEEREHAEMLATALANVEAGRAVLV